MLDKQAAATMFIDVIKAIKQERSLAYAVIAKLTMISRMKLYNIIYGKSKPGIEEIQKLLTVFPHYKLQFIQIEGLGDLKIAESYDTREEVKSLRDKLMFYEKGRKTDEETIKSLKEEILHLKEIIALQNLLLKEHGIVKD